MPVVVFLFKLYCKIAFALSSHCSTQVRFLKAQKERNPAGKYPILRYTVLGNVAYFAGITPILGVIGLVIALNFGWPNHLERHGNLREFQAVVQPHVPLGFCLHLGDNGLVLTAPNGAQAPFKVDVPQEAAFWSTYIVSSVKPDLEAASIALRSEPANEANFRNIPLSHADESLTRSKQAWAQGQLGPAFDYAKLAGRIRRAHLGDQHESVLEVVAITRRMMSAAQVP